MVTGVSENFLVQAAVFLAAAAIAAPIAKKLQISSVLGYLAAGIFIGPFGLGFVYAVYQVEGILHIAEYGVVLLLFVIGLELKPQRLWLMRNWIFGLGASQVALTAVLLTPVLILAGLPWDKASLIGVSLALSSTAFVLQVLDEKDELALRHGRAAFTTLLFQDLAAIPLIASVPFLASLNGDGTTQSFSVLATAQAVGAVILIFFVGRYVLSTLYSLVASTRVREAMTASALLTVVGVALLMETVGLSAVLGAFLAGALLADSPYRHQIEADIEPFKGLLLGLFFTAIGMGLNLNVLGEHPLFIVAMVLALIAVKAAVLYALGLLRGLDHRASRRFALALSQGGEFAFVVFTLALAHNVLDRGLVELLSVIVTLSMLATPLLLLIDDILTPKKRADDRPHDSMPEEEGHVVIAGIGRFGQIVARILKARGIPFTALDGSPEQVALVGRFGSRAYFGDARRLPILEAAQVKDARAFVLTISDPQASLETAQVVRQHFPDVPIYARARDRQHVHRLMDLGVKIIQRDSFLSALDLSGSVLRKLNISEREIERTLKTFREHDERRLYEDYEHFTDLQKLQDRAKKQSEELEELLRQDQDVEDVGKPTVVESR